MEPEIDITIEGPVVYVYDEDETYDSMFEQRQSFSEVTTKSTRERKSPLERIISDCLAAVFIYFGTFILCDFIRTVREGQWTPLYWSIWGPYKYLTGAPLITRIIKRMEPTSCEDKTEDWIDDCEDNGWHAHGLLNLVKRIINDDDGMSDHECEGWSQVYMIHCQNKGLQGDTKEMMCQRQADDWMIEYIQNYDGSYSISDPWNTWMATYNQCLAASVDPPDIDRPEDPPQDEPLSNCDIAYNDCMDTALQVYQDPAEAEYVCTDLKYACNEEWPSMQLGCQQSWEAFDDCYKNRPVDAPDTCNSLFLDAISCSSNMYANQH